MSASTKFASSHFKTLERFIPVWALPTEADRSARRWQATPEEFRDFYETTLPQLDELLAYVDQFTFGEMPVDALPFYHLALAFAEVAPHCELYGDSNKVPNSFAAERFVAAFGAIEDR